MALILRRMPSCVSLAGSNSAQISRSNLSPESHSSTGSVIIPVTPRKVLRDSQWSNDMYRSHPVSQFGLCLCNELEAMHPGFRLRNPWMGRVVRGLVPAVAWHLSLNGKSNGSNFICSPFIWTDKYKKKPWRNTAEIINSTVPETCAVFILYVRSFQSLPG